MGNLLSLIAGGAKTLLMAAEELGAETQTAAEMLPALWADWQGLAELLIRFLLNTAVIGLIVRVFYYPKSKRRDYFFTFILISISVFQLIVLSVLDAAHRIVALFLQVFEPHAAKTVDVRCHLAVGL